MVANARGSAKSAVDFDAHCSDKCSVGTFVYISNSSSSGLLEVESIDIRNKDTSNFIGVIVSMYSPNKCKVRTAGMVNSNIILISGKKYFIGFDGKLTGNRPSPGPGEKIVLCMVALAVSPSRYMLTLGNRAIVLIG